MRKVSLIAAMLLAGFVGLAADTYDQIMADRTAAIEKADKAAVAKLKARLQNGSSAEEKEKINAQLKELSGGGLRVLENAAPDNKVGAKYAGRWMDDAGSQVWFELKMDGTWNSFWPDYFGTWTITDNEFAVVSTGGNRSEIKLKTLPGGKLDWTSNLHFVLKKGKK